MIKIWLKQMRSNRTFTQHFQIIHEFHGITQNLIQETYTIRPTTNLSLQMLIDGIQISDQELHLKSKIYILSDAIKISLKVIDPHDSEEILNQIKKTLVKQLISFERRFYSSPVVQYVERFCNQCVHNQSKPLNQCISRCKFEPKELQKEKETVT